MSEDEDTTEVEEFGPVKARYIVETAAAEYEDDEGDMTSIYEGEVPEDDDEVIAAAVEVVEMALEAVADGWESEALTEVIEAYETDEDDLVEEDEDSDDDDSEEEAEEDGEEADDDADDDGEEADEEAEDDDSEDETEEPEPLKPPWRGYDSRTVAQLKKSLPKKEDDELSDAFEYESAKEKPRQTVLDLITKIATERQADPDDPTDDGDDEEATDADGMTANDEEIEAILADLEPDDHVRVAKGRKTMVIMVRNIEDMAKAGYVISDDQENLDGTDDDDDISDTRTEEIDEEEEAPKKVKKGKKSKPKTAEVDGDYDPDHLEIVQAVHTKFEDENLSVPKRLPEDIIQMPFDLTELSNTEIRQFHGAFNAYSSRAAYVLMIEEQCERACRLIADQKAVAFIETLSKIDEETKKAKTVTALENEANQDEEVALWRGRAEKHGSVAIVMRKERDMYDKNVTVLSREWTMRSEEFDQSGGLNNRSKKKNV